MILYSTSHVLNLLLLPRAKILGCMARGGIADPDAPNCQESTKYWATTTTEHKIVDDDTSSVAMSSNINPQHALQAFNAPLAVAIDKGDAEFNHTLKNIIRLMHEDGTLSELSKKWHGVDYSKSYRE